MRNLRLHSLNTYIMKGTDSRDLIIKHYDELKKEILERAEFGNSDVRVFVNERDTALVVDEGGTVRYPIRLGCKPDLEVAIKVETEEPIDLVKSEFVFDPLGDWKAEQHVVVKVRDGLLEEIDEPFGFDAWVYHTSRSADPTFDKVPIERVEIGVLPGDLDLEEPTEVPEEDEDEGDEEPSGSGGGGSASGTFPAEPFNSMLVQYSVSGIAVDEQTDGEGFTMSRTLTGSLGGDTLTVSGTAYSDRDHSDAFPAYVEVRVNVEGETAEYRDETSGNEGPWNSPFSVSVPIPPGAEKGSFSITLVFVNPRFGNRAVWVGGGTPEP